MIDEQDRNAVANRICKLAVARDERFFEWRLEHDLRLILDFALGDQRIEPIELIARQPLQRA